MKFVELFWLYLLPALVPAVIALWAWSARRRRVQLDRIIAPRLRDQLLGSVNFARRRWKQALTLTGLCLILCALARPQMGNREVRVELPGIDYFVAMDISKSMLAEDVADTNRITAAKTALAKLLGRPSGDRVGLIAFAGDAFLVSPISQDHSAIERSINALTTTSISKPGTDIASAIRLALKSFEKKQEAGKAILLISDGEELQGDAVIAAREAARDKVAVFTVGIGSSIGARIPDRSKGQLKYAKNEFGREVNTRLNERVLQQVANAGKGAYVHLDATGDTLLSLYDRGLKLLPKGTHVRKSQDRQEAYQWPLAAAILLLLMEMLVSERKKRHDEPLPMKNVLLGLCLIALLPVAGACADLGDARRQLRDNQPDQAAATIQQLQSLKPGDPWLAYDLGVAAYAAKDYNKAEQIWQELATRELPEKLRDKVWLQIGNASFRKGEPLETTDPQTTLQLWEQSREAYRICLVVQPKDKEINHNIRVVETRLARLHARLAEELLKQSQKIPLEQQIEKMQAALDHQRTAETLDPRNEQYQKDRKQTEKTLSENYVQKALKEEKRTDNVLKNPNANTWERKNAEEQLQKALSDFQEAKTLDEKNEPAVEGEERVKDKLAQLLTRDGRQFQKEAAQQESRSADAAEEKYEQALDKFEQALALKPELSEAKQGEQEVKQALEQLHMKEGDRLAKQGEQELKRKQDTRAASNLTEALNHYQEALTINPENQEAPPKIAELQKMLPSLLNAVAEQERNKSAEQEPKSLEKAIAHMEKAATSFQKSQEIQPDNNEPAQKGEQQSREDLVRMRRQLAERNQQQAKQEQQEDKNKSEQQDQESFYTMLRHIKNEDKQREYEQSRRAPTEKYTPDQNRIYKNW